MSTKKTVTRLRDWYSHTRYLHPVLFETKLSEGRPPCPLGDDCPGRHLTRSLG